MSLTTYGGLKNAIRDWLDNDELEPQSDVLIAIAESRFNRVLRTPEMETRDTITVGGAAVDSVDLWSDFLELRALHIEDTTDLPLTYRSPEFVELVRNQLTDANARFYSVAGTTLTFAPQAAANTVFSGLYFAKITGLSESNSTNWLSLAHPDLYLYATLVAAEGLGHNDPRMATWKTLLDEGLSELRQVSDIHRLGDENVTRRRSRKGVQ